MHSRRTEVPCILRSALDRKHTAQRPRDLRGINKLGVIFNPLPLFNDIGLLIESIKVVLSSQSLKKKHGALYDKGTDQGVARLGNCLALG